MSLNDYKQIITYKLELQIPYSVCAKIQENGILYK